MKKIKPKIAAFLAQPTGALVGPEESGKPFRDHWELCRWLAEIGYEGVTVPACAPFVDVKKLLRTRNSASVLDRYAECGTPLLRLEKHTVGQRMLLHPAQLGRYAPFAPEFSASDARDHRDREVQATFEALDIVEASAILSFKHLVTFSGNRGWTAAKYPWSAYPKEWRLYILLLVLAKHRSVLARCAEHGIKMGFELHPEEDINSPLLLYLLREIAKQAAPETVKAIYTLADASHPTMAGDEAAMHFKFLAKHDLLGMCHLKDAELGQNYLDSESLEWQGGSVRGDFSPRWSESWRRFCTFGTGMADWKKIVPVLKTVHEGQEEGLDLVVEGECSKFPDMMQCLELAFQNAKLARAGKPLKDHHNTKVKAPVGGSWEDFCVGPTSATDLLKMNAQESAIVEALKCGLDTSILARL